MTEKVAESLDEIERTFTDRERFFYKRGFAVAMNFLYFHHQTEQRTERPDADKAAFEQFLKLHINDTIVDEALSLLSKDGGCRPGYCEDSPGHCVLCGFRFAFEPETYVRPTEIP